MGKQSLFSLELTKNKEKPKNMKLEVEKENQIEFSKNEENVFKEKEIQLALQKT